MELVKTKLKNSEVFDNHFEVSIKYIGDEVTARDILDSFKSTMNMIAYNREQKKLEEKCDANS